MTTKLFSAAVVAVIAIGSLSAGANSYWKRLAAEKEATEWKLALLTNAKNKGPIAEFKQLVTKTRYPKVDVRDEEGNTPFILACQFGNLEAVRYLLSINPSQNYSASPLLMAVNHNGHAAIHAAVAAGSLEVVKYLTGGHSSVLAIAVLEMRTEETKMSPLQVAVELRKKEIVEALIKARANVNYVDAKGRTALMIAGGVRAEPIYQALLQANADITITDATGRTCLHYATTSHSVPCVLSTLSHWSRLQTESLTKPVRPIPAPRPRSSTIPRVKFAPPHVQLGDFLDAADATGRTPLMYAGDAGFDDIMRALLDAGADVNKEGPAGYSMLLYGTRSGSVDAVNLVLDRCEDPEAIWKVDGAGHTALHIASMNSHAPVIQTLLRRPRLPALYVNHPSKYTGSTALHLACEYLHDTSGETVRVLLGVEGVEVDRRDFDGRTALGVCCVNSWGAGGGVAREVVAELICAGADVRVVDKAGRSVLDLAYGSSNKEALEYIEIYLEKTYPDYLREYKGNGKKQR